MKNWHVEKIWSDKETGYLCKVMRCDWPELPRMKEHYCGYVTFHPTHGFKVKDNDFDAFMDVLVHGGVTFVQNGHDGSITVGFDCAHHGDHLPDGTTRWKPEDVIEQTELLAIGIRDKMKARHVH